MHDGGFPFGVQCKSRRQECVHGGHILCQLLVNHWSFKVQSAYWGHGLAMSSTAAAGMSSTATTVRCSATVRGSAAVRCSAA